MVILSPANTLLKTNGENNKPTPSPAFAVKLSCCVLIKLFKPDVIESICAVV